MDGERDLLGYHNLNDPGFYIAINYVDSSSGVFQVTYTLPQNVQSSNVYLEFISTAYGPLGTITSPVKYSEKICPNGGYKCNSVYTYTFGRNQGAAIGRGTYSVRLTSDTSVNKRIYASTRNAPGGQTQLSITW